MNTMKSYMIPLRQSRKVNPSFSIDMFALPDDHVVGRCQEANGGSEGEGIHQPQHNREVVGASFVTNTE